VGPKTEKHINRLVIISNRLPIIIEKNADDWTTIPGSGGLVTALAPVLKNRGGMWIGWPGTEDMTDVSKPLEDASISAGFTMKAVLMTRDEVQKYYIGLSNEVLWPLFHDLQSYCNFEPSYWDTYVDINARFAEVIKENTTDDDFIWVHDYHLINIAQELRRLGSRARIAFFLHIPFPPLDIFFKLPWRSEILQALLEYDLIGFQTLRDRRNFLQCIRALTKGVIINGKGQVIEAKIGERSLRIGAFPISIDYNNFVSMAKSKEVADAAWFIHEKLPGYQIILGIDRLDYTKGITYRIKALRDALKRYPELVNKVILVQVVVPSRRNIPVYQQLKEEIEKLVGEINGEFTKSGWVPIHYIHRPLEKMELLAYYRTAEIALITPLKDGMNLVSKEYCASSIEENGVLILSEFAGAAAQLQKGALLVNPYNIREVADAIYRAFKMEENERKVRMKKMRQTIRRNDIFWWVNSFLQAAISHNLENFPLVEDYLPTFNV